jgi:ABC-type glycerol-3-phosphate transport system substrate-binding protein
VRKRFVLLLVLVLALTLGAAAAPAAAVPTDDLTAFAELFPQDTTALFSFRTDDGYIDALDGVIARLNAALPTPIMPMTLRESLDQAAATSGDSFDSLVRSWLGDKASLGVDAAYLFDDDPDNDFLAGLLVIELRDRAAAEAFWTRALRVNESSVGYTVSEMDGMTVYTPNEPGNLDGFIPFALADDYMLVGNLEIAMSVEQPLSAAEQFQDAVVALPAGDYNLTLYLDGDLLLAGSVAMQQNIQNTFDEIIANLGATPPPPTDFNQMFTDAFAADIGGIALGATILDERSLTLDMAFAIEPETLSAALGTMLEPSMLDATLVPVDLSFAQYIPAGTPLVTHITDLNTIYQTVLASLEAVAMVSGGDPQQGMQELQAGLQGVQFAVRGLTGLDLEEDILSWMTGDVALWLSPAASVSEVDELFAAIQLGLPLDFGLLISAQANPEGAAALVDGLEQALEFAAAQLPEGSSTELRLSSENIGGTDVVVATVFDRSLPFPLELVIGANDAVFVLGTRAAAEAALNPTNPLTSDPLFQEAARYLLPNTTQVQYLSGVGFVPLLNLLIVQMGSNGATLIPAFAGLISSSSITTSTDANGVGLLRMVLTLAE